MYKATDDRDMHIEPFDLQTFIISTFVYTLNNMSDTLWRRISGLSESNVSLLRSPNKFRAHHDPLRSSQIDSC